MTTVATDTKRRALGKGLDSLLPRVSPPPAADPVEVAAPAPAAPAQGEAGKPLEVELDRIDLNPYQTRSYFDEQKLNELAASILANGILMPILVRPLPEGRYLLIAGERRLRATKILGKKTIPVLVRQVSNEQAMEITIVENLQRENLNPIEQAKAFERLGAEFQLTQEQIADRTGKERATVGNSIRLLRLPESVQAQVGSGELSAGHAKALMGLNHHPEIERVAHKVVAQGLNVRDTEMLVQGMLYPEREKKESKPQAELDPNVREVAERLQRALGLKVRIEDRKGRGRVIIEYSTIADFDILLEGLTGE
jgi:ParB family transcriptional regulator, chromosome partitioning protein